MKKSIIFLLLLSLGMIGCQEQEISEKGIQKPVQTRTITTVKSPYFQWDDTTVVKSKYYGDILLPWYNGASVQLPEFIINDYKAEDGWELVYNFIANSPVVEKGKNYLMFYNKFTGTLRVFYNHRSTTGGHGTTFWKFALDNRSALLNGAGTYYTEPASVRKNSPSIYTSNITTVESKSIYKGWNCFDVDMCYDPLQKNEPLQMSISSYSKNESDITLEGRLDLKSKGTIIAGTSNKYSGVLGFVAKGAGDGVDRYVNKLLKDTVNGKPNHNIFKDKIVKALPAIIQGKVPDILSGGTTALVKAGVNLLFGSFLQRANRPIVQELKFTTKGTVKIKGQMKSISGSEVVPVANLKVPGTPNSYNDHFMPSFDKSLGVFNLKEKPLIEVKREMKQNTYFILEGFGMFDRNNFRRNMSFPSDEGSFGHRDGRFPSPIVKRYMHVYRQLFTIKKTDVLINEDVKKCLKSWKVSVGLVHDNEDMPEGILCYGGDYGVQSFYVYKGSNCQIKFIHDIVTLGMFNVIPTGYEGDDRMLPSSESPEKVIKTNSIIRDNFVVKVTVTLYPKAPYNQDPIIMTRSYIPEYKLVN